MFLALLDRPPGRTAANRKWPRWSQKRGGKYRINTGQIQEDYRKNPDTPAGPWPCARQPVVLRGPTSSVVSRNCHSYSDALEGGRGLPQSKTLRAFWRIGRRASVWECVQPSGAFATHSHAIGCRLPQPRRWADARPETEARSQRPLGCFACFHLLKRAERTTACTSGSLSVAWIASYAAPSASPDKA